MNKLLNIIGSIPKDKLLHYIGGVLIYAVCARLTEWYIAITIVFVISFIKEFYDKMRGGTTEVMDIVAAMLGGVTMLLINLIP